MTSRLTVGTGQSAALGVGSTTATYTTFTGAGGDWKNVFASHPLVDTNGSYIAIATDGSLWGWGKNFAGVLGLGDSVERTSPVQIMVGPVATACIGDSSAYAIRTNGTLWVWGTNENGQLGLGDLVARGTPTQVGVLTTWSKVAAGRLFAVATQTDGTLWTAGDNTNGCTAQGTSVGNTTTWTQVGIGGGWYTPVCGTSHCFVHYDNAIDIKLRCWGSGAAGQLGSAHAAGSNNPVVPTSALWASYGTGTHIWTGIAAEGNSTIVWDGANIYVTGDNASGQLWSATASIADWEARTGTTPSAVFTGKGTTVIKTSTGAFATGKNTSYALGLPSASNYTALTSASDLFGVNAFASSGLTSQALVVAAEAVTDSALAQIIASPSSVTSFSSTDTASLVDVLLAITDVYQSATDSGVAADVFLPETLTYIFESAVFADAADPLSNTSSELSDSAFFTDIIQQAISQLVSDSASGVESFSIGAALSLVDIADAVATQTSTYNSVMLVSELIASIDAFNAADGYDIMESSAVVDGYAALVRAIANVIDAAIAIDVSTGILSVYQVVSDTGMVTDTATNNSILTEMLTEGAVAIVRLNIGGELFTGWVLNADTLAPSEYQFADLNFNSACKHGNRYLMAADDGIYQFTEDVGVESVMTYIKTGKTDFGSDKHKRIINSYMVYSATGQMRLKVTTSENGQIRTHTYQMAPFANNETTDTRRFDIGKGPKSRYWQFEIVGEGVDCEFDEIGMLPVILSRRI